MTRRGMEGKENGIRMWRTKSEEEEFEGRIKIQIRRGESKHVEAGWKS